MRQTYNMQKVNVKQHCIFSRLPLIQIDNLIMHDMNQTGVMMMMITAAVVWEKNHSGPRCCSVISSRLNSQVNCHFSMVGVLRLILITMCCIAQPSFAYLAKLLKEAWHSDVSMHVDFVKRIITKFKGKWWHSPVSRWAWAPWKPYDLFTQSLLST